MAQVSQMKGVKLGRLIHPGRVWASTRTSWPRHVSNRTRGNVYALSSTGGATNLCDVMFVRSTNGGANWSAPRRINTDPGTNAYHWFGRPS